MYFYRHALLSNSLEKHFVSNSDVTLAFFWCNSEVTELEVEGSNMLSNAHKDSYDGVEFNATKYRRVTSYISGNAGNTIANN